MSVGRLPLVCVLALSGPPGCGSPARRIPAPELVPVASRAGASAQARGFYLRGRVLAEHGALEQARVELEWVTRLDPMAPGPWSALAELHARIGDQGAAVEAYRRALDLGAPWWDRAALVELLVVVAALDEAEAELQRWAETEEALDEGGTTALDELRFRVDSARGIQ